METFTFGESHEPHEKGNPECPACWGDYPTPHYCGGLMHAEFGDENWDSYWLYYQCDQCAETSAPD